MKLVVQVKLQPTPQQTAALEATLRACNAAASDVAGMAREIGCYRNYDLRKHAYHGIKADYRLGAQAAQHVIKKVADAYATLKANLRAGNYGRPGSPRRRRVETNPVNFRWNAAQPYDIRMLSWQHDARTVSIWTVVGRLKSVAFTGSADQLKAVATLPVGESDLVHRDGMWFLYVTVETPEAETYEPDGFLGVTAPATPEPSSTDTDVGRRACVDGCKPKAPSPPGVCSPGGGRRKHGTPRTSTTPSPRQS